MRFVIAQRRLAHPGGSESFCLTIAEHLTKLGHEVIIYAREVGAVAESAARFDITLIWQEWTLPPQADATIALDRTMAVELAGRYPNAARLYAMHNADEVWLPPPEPGIVAATLAPNERLAMLARACTGAGEVVRIRQPIDMYRFSPKGWANPRPRRILLLGNYLGLSTERSRQLQTAWSNTDLEWHRLGGETASLEVASEIAKADIVVGYGRSILEAMSCGRPAYLHEHSGSDGWVTSDTYSSMEADGFSGTGVRQTPSIDELRADLDRYDPMLGRLGQDLIRANHDARLITSEIAAAALRILQPIEKFDAGAVKALRNLAESRFRADGEIHEYRNELGRRLRELGQSRTRVDDLEREVSELQRQSKGSEQWRNRVDELERELSELRRQLKESEQWRNRVDELERELSELRRQLKESEQWRTRADELERELSELRRQLKESEQWRNRVDELERELSELRRQLKESEQWRTRADNLENDLAQISRSRRLVWANRMLTPIDRFRRWSLRLNVGTKK